MQVKRLIDLNKSLTLEKMLDKLAYDKANEITRILDTEKGLIIEYQ